MQDEDLGGGANGEPERDERENANDDGDRQLTLADDVDTVRVEELTDCRCDSDHRRIDLERLEGWNDELSSDPPTYRRERRGSPRKTKDS